MNKNWWNVLIGVITVLLIIVGFFLQGAYSKIEHNERRSVRCQQDQREMTVKMDYIKEAVDRILKKLEER